METLAFNLLMATVDAAALGLVRRRRTLRASLLAAVGTATAALALAVALRDEHFGTVRLLAWALCLHGTILLCGAAVLLWRARPFWARAAVVAAIGLVATAADAFLIEPTWLEVTRHEIASAKIIRPMRIVVIADVQVDAVGPYEEETFRRAADQQPDVVLFAGDYVQASNSDHPRLCEKLRRLVENLQRQTGARMFAVQGNVDGYDWHMVFQGLAATCVERTSHFEIDGVDLTCLSLGDSTNSRLRVKRPSDSRFHIVLGHIPAYANGTVDADLLLAGHTHGGQARLPLIGPLLTGAAIPRAWAAGLNVLPSGARLIVSRGIGMERAGAPRFRFCCRPELVVIDLVPEEPTPPPPRSLGE